MNEFGRKRRLVPLVYHVYMNCGENQLVEFNPLISRSLVFVVYF